MRKFKKTITTIMTVAALALAGTAAFAEEASVTDATPEDAETATPDAGSAEFDPNGVYHAAMGIQTCNTAWINRQAYFTDELNKYYGTDMNDKLWAGDPSANGSVYDGTFTDIEIKGNGTYTVKLEGADFSGEEAISQLYVATDIPVNDKIKVTNFNVNINGKDICTFDEAELEDEEKYTAGGMIILAINHWRPPLVQKLESLAVYEDDANGIKLLTGAGNENVTLTFTISGFDYDNEAAASEDTEEQTSEEASADDATTEATTEAKKDDKEKKSNFPVVPVVAGVVVVIGAVAAVVLKKKK